MWIHCGSADFQLNIILYLFVLYEVSLLIFIFNLVFIIMFNFFIYINIFESVIWTIKQMSLFQFSKRFICDLSFIFFLLSIWFTKLLILFIKVLALLNFKWIYLWIYHSTMKCVRFMYLTFEVLRVDNIDIRYLM